MLEQRQFKEIQSLLYEASGITIADHKQQMVQNRIAKRFKALELRSSSDYLSYIKQGKNPDEIVNLINALTTNVTYFYREKHHFEHLVKHIDALIKAGQRKIRIWSAGCSIGAEPYSAAILIYECILKKGISADIKILATDIDTAALNTGRQGFYSEKTIKGLSKARLLEHFTREHKDDENGYRIKGHIRRLVFFNHLNMNLAKWPMKGPFDFIFCRNLLIYFDRPKQSEFVGKMKVCLAPGGYLYLGHSEHAASEGMGLKAQSQTIYQKL